MQGRDLPRQIRHYVIERLLATGGMGDVYVARHEVTQLRVALKVMKVLVQDAPAQRARFLREVRAAARIGHPGIVRVYDAGQTEEGDLYLAMELLDGRSLEALFREETDLQTRIAPVVGMLVPLKAAHDRGIVHRDLKPANVFVVERRGRPPEVKLLDFGIASDVADQRVTQTGVFLGTPFYMSPEQAFTPSEAGAASDIWSFGVMLYEALSGRVPFEGETAHAVVLRSSSQPHPPLQSVMPGLPAELCAVVDACLEKEPGRRPADAGIVLSRLAPLLLDGSLDGARSRVSEPPGRGPRQVDRDVLQLSLAPDGTEPADRPSSVPSLDPDTVAPRAFELPRRRTRGGGGFRHSVFLLLLGMAAASASALYAMGKLPLGRDEVPAPPAATAGVSPVQPATTAGAPSEAEAQVTRAPPTHRTVRRAASARRRSDRRRPQRAREEHRGRPRPGPRRAAAARTPADAGVPQPAPPVDFGSFVPAPAEPAVDGGLWAPAPVEDPRTSAGQPAADGGTPRHAPVQLDLPFPKPLPTAGEAPDAAVEAPGR